LKTDPVNLRKKIAREAADLLYSEIEKEYKQAKLKAARVLGTNLLPANIEIAAELDNISEEREGPARQERLVGMRREALGLMKLLGQYAPVLLGSVWRGTIHHQSDVDITVYSDEPQDIVEVLKKGGTRILRTELMPVTEHGQKRTSMHIHMKLHTKDEAEIVVRGAEEVGRVEKCEKYGDRAVGLNVKQLERLLKENPVRRFVPS